MKVASGASKAVASAVKVDPKVDLPKVDLPKVEMAQNFPKVAFDQIPEA